MELKDSLWQSRITITQAPEPFESNHVQNYIDPFYKEEESIRSFLYDPFGSNFPFSYGLEIVASRKIEWTFFTYGRSKERTLQFGHAWLYDLKYKFKGLDGVVSVSKIDFKEEEINEIIELNEIFLPRHLVKQKMDFIQRFINDFYYNKDYKVKLIIFWKRVPTNIDKEDIGEPIFYLRIFIHHDPICLKKGTETELLGLIMHLFLDIEDNKGNRAELKLRKSINKNEFLAGDVFKNIQGHQSVYNTESVYFDFPEDLPLPKIPMLKNENVRYIDIDEEYIKNAIKIGKHIKDGVISDRITYIPINKLPQDLVIFGKSGSGKTCFLASLIQDLCEKVRNVGVLALNVAKQAQQVYYNNFKVIKYSDKDFHVPYFVKGEFLEKTLQETATYICASLGLKNVFEKIIYRTGLNFIKNDKKMPEFFIHLLKGVENYVEKNPYGRELQVNILQALRNRIRIFAEEKIQQVLKLSSELPNWVKNWLKGGKIFLDLSMCNKFTKQVVINSIFQLIRTITKDIEAEELKHLIVIDEAHAIVEKPITRNPDDADFIMKEQMTKIFSELLKEYRSRGVGFIIADQSPSRLFDDVASQPSIKIIFRQDYPNNTLFSGDPFERQLLTQLENRLALVINGATGEKYLIRTLNYDLHSH